MTQSNCKDSSTQQKIISENLRNFSTWKMKKNFIVLCIAFYLFYIPIGTALDLQSTMNQQEGKGVASVGITFASSAIASFILSKYLICKLGCKICLQISILSGILYMASIFYFVWVIIIPVSILNGIIHSLFWTALCAYTNQLAINYSCSLVTESDNQVKHTDNTTNAENNKCKPKNDADAEKQLDTLDNNKIQKFVKKSELNTISENVSSCVCYDDFMEHSSKGFRRSKYYINDKPKLNNLKMLCDSSVSVPVPSINPDEYLSSEQCVKYKEYISQSTSLFFGIIDFFYCSAEVWGNLISHYVMRKGVDIEIIYDSDNCTCGRLFCNAELSCFENNLAEPEQRIKNTIAYIFIGLIAASLLVLSIFLDRMEKGKEHTGISCNLLLATGKFLRRKKALFVIPMSFMVGLVEGFYLCDFVKSYVACSWGTHHVGIVTVSYGALAGISSAFFGWLVKHIGRIAVILTGNILGVVACIFCLVWTPHASEPVFLFLAAGIWGSAVGILSPQTKAYYGVLFKKDEAAFAACRMWISSGFCLAVAYSNFLCSYVKLSIMLFTILLGTAGYLGTEYISCRHSKRTRF